MSTSPVRLVEVGPGDAAFPAWCAVWAAAELADRPDEAPRPVSEHVVLGRQLAEPGTSKDGTHRAAVLGDDVVGALRLIHPVRDNTTVTFVDLAVHPDHRRRGVGRALLAEALALAADAGRTELITEVDEPGPDAPGRLFAQRAGWTCALLETRRDLVLPADEGRLAAVEAEAWQASRGYEVVTWRDHVPDALLADRALLEERMSTDAPHGELPVEEERWDAARIRETEELNVARGRAVLSAGAVRDGRLVAFTDLHVSLGRVEHARQGATLVLREHRGHRLGALVKAAVLRDHATAFPGTRRISTYNLEGNAPMVAVNESLGFVPAGQLSMWSLRRDVLGAP
ncbi:GNAT family N-acetyltransferase [Blastococcus sp. TML/M2B]|uniref:GNAT family N-acetyltransferase n=1 Tax=unclassified Blastococcus TaxID=2619396 RepID=UPI00190B3C21|nr:MULTISPECIES: GNAT family N-acetyltransferase [unclassified Blastococcus]MBN1092323.1 GNAT family N-acetyltransferase [Blastococcus sp. TML/M2B]MBN1097584.1 GNAT family N-acetyltransferase [Blastococcus sp. TML/C7B]